MRLKKILRVNHAGELGAVYICKGQNFIKSKNQDEINLLKSIAEQEGEHLKYFENQMVKNSVPVSIFHQFWKVSAFSIGTISKLLNKHHECTVAVETVIEKHYESQLKEIDENNIDKELFNKIKQFKNDETEHKDKSKIHVKNFDSLFSKTVKKIVKTAIWISSKL